MKDDLRVAPIVMNHINQSMEVVLKRLSENEKVLNNIEKELAELKSEKSGKWIKTMIYDIWDNGSSYSGYKCSCCENEERYQSNYCPSCGSKME